MNKPIEGEVVDAFDGLTDADIDRIVGRLASRGIIPGGHQKTAKIALRPILTKLNRPLPK